MQWNTQRLRQGLMGEQPRAAGVDDRLHGSRQAVVVGIHFLSNPGERFFDLVDFTVDQRACGLLRAALDLEGQNQGLPADPYCT